MKIEDLNRRILRKLTADQMTELVQLRHKGTSEEGRNVYFSRLGLVQRMWARIDEKKLQKEGYTVAYTPSGQRYEYRA